MLAELEASVGQMYFTGKGKAKDYKKSELLFKSAINRDKNCFRALYYLGVLDYNSHNYVDAVNNLQKSIVSCTDKKVKSDIYYVIGVCYYAENQTKFASQAFQKSLEMNPNNVFTKKFIAKYNMVIK